MRFTFDRNRAKYSFFGVLISYILAHAYSCFNYTPIWDTVNHTFNDSGIPSARLGRYFRVFIPIIRGRVTAPWLISIISMLFIFVATYLIAEMLEFKKPVSVFLTGVTLSADLCVTAIKVLHVYIEDAFMLSFVLAILGVYLIWRKDKGFWLIAPICFFVSFGLYQGLSTTIVVMVLILVFKYVYMDGRIDASAAKRLMEYVICVLFGIILYVVGCLVLKLFGFTFISGSDNTLDYAFGIDLIGLVDQTYDNLTELIRLFFIPYNSHEGGFSMINFLQIGGCVLAIISIMVIIQKSKDKKNKISWFMTLILLSGLIAVSALTVNILSQIKFLAFRLVYAIFLIYLLFIGIITEWDNPVNNTAKWSFKAMICAFALIFFWNVRMSNDVYIVQQYSYERASIAVAKMLDDLEDNYDIRTPVVLVGNLALNGSYKDYISDYEPYFVGLSNTSIGYQSITKSLVFLLGPELCFEDDESIKGEYEMKPEVINMPSYPNKGYCNLVDGRIVIKLSDSE